MKRLKLKGRIVEKYGTQADFAMEIKEDESLVSRVIRGRRQINPEKQKTWARALGCGQKEFLEMMNTGVNHG